VLSRYVGSTKSPRHRRESQFSTRRRQFNTCANGSQVISANAPRLRVPGSIGDRQIRQHVLCVRLTMGPAESYRWSGQNPCVGADPTIRTPVRAEARYRSTPLTVNIARAWLPQMHASKLTLFGRAFVVRRHRSRTSGLTQSWSTESRQSLRFGVDNAHN